MSCAIRLPQPPRHEQKHAPDYRSQPNRSSQPIFRLSPLDLILVESSPIVVPRVNVIGVISSRFGFAISAQRIDMKSRLRTKRTDTIQLNEHVWVSPSIHRCFPIPLPKVHDIVVVVLDCWIQHQLVNCPQSNQPNFI